MVKKLIKYDFIGFGRIMIPTFIALLGLGLLNRIIQLFESNTSAYSITFVSSCVVLGIGIVVSLVLTLITCITRFYKTLFTSEGYLSFTLPVSVGQHIFSKLFVSVVYFIINAIVIIISGAIATFGDVLAELWKAFVYIMKDLHKHYSYHITLYSIETIIAIIVSTATSLLLIYACISIGQLARKNRVACAVGVYFGYYLLTQIIATIFIIILVVFGDVLPLREIAEFIDNHTLLSTHLIITISTVINAIFAFIYYKISSKILRNRLNLE